MAEHEKIIHALECCFDVQSGWKDAVWVCPACPYAKNNGQPCETLAPLLDDAITLLKTQQPRVMTLEEVRLLSKDAVVWYEHKGVARQPRPRVVEFVFDEHITFTDGGNWSFSADGYGECWRLWTSRPTDEQREAEVWK